MLKSAYNFILITCCLFGLGACVFPQDRIQDLFQVETPIPATLTAWQIKAVQESVRDQLKYPKSARFASKVIATRKPNGDVTACGMVNTKNSSGRYIGMSPFVVRLRGGKVIDSSTGSGREAEFVISLCRQEGGPV
jgi:hypothetical protein